MSDTTHHVLMRLLLSPAQAFQIASGHTKEDSELAVETLEKIGFMVISKLEYESIVERGKYFKTAYRIMCKSE